MCYGFSSTRCTMLMSRAMFRREPLCQRRVRLAQAASGRETVSSRETMASGRNITVSETSRPKLPRHARLKFDETRQVWVLLAPERVLAPDEIAVEVLHLCDGGRSVTEMVDQLAAKYAAPREAIATDVVAMLQDLADKGFLTEAREKTP